MTDLPKGYDPSQVEDKWYAEWLARGCFTARPERAFNGTGLSPEQKARERAKGLREAYAIVIPPPNVTGILHMGHVLNNTLQDILVRRKRMQGFEALWLPGIDHAGIATQAVVERQLRKEERKTRHDLGREEFLRRVWTWKDKHGDIILQQLKKLGCSCDWSRVVFTMDGLDPRVSAPRINYSRWVSEVFVRLYQKGLIYRGRRMVNWCVVARSALSDEEVIMKESKGHLWHLRYPLIQSGHRKHLVVATTRPETMLGDTAVAVHPEDERYRHLVGQKLRLPLTDREILIIADAAVDPKFGTGCVKVTPAHDPADFDMGQRHQLEQIQVIGFDGRMTDAAGADYAGLDRYECREKVVADLQELDLLEKVEDHTHNVGYSERADVPAEPMVSEQWFLKYPAAEPSLRAALDKEIVFWPDRWLKVYEHWMTGLRDWCISRQLWWGHRIPVWTRPKIENEELRIKNGKDGEDTGLGTQNMAVETYVGVEAPQGEGWVQDPDVLDTWFSSWLWPFATLIPDPDEAAGHGPDSEIAKFYPTQDLVTAPEILFFWVARMIMAGFEFKGGKPFGNVYLHGTVRDRQGRKMSKSLGNSPDPLDLIARQGADALRFGLMRCAPLGLDVRFDEQQVELGRNFCNKLWNAARLRLAQGAPPRALQPLDGLSAANLSSDDRAILLRVEETIRDINALYDQYEFHQVAARLYELFWANFCDWYLEAAKPFLYGSDEKRKAAVLAVMDHALNAILRLLHPFIPFITEELWHALGFEPARAEDDARRGLQFAPWPQPLPADEAQRLGLDVATLQWVEKKYAAVTAGRNLRAAYRIPANRKTRFCLAAEGDWASDPRETLSLQSLLNAEPLDFVKEAPRGAASAVTPVGAIYLPLAGLVEADVEQKRLEGQIAKLEKELEGIRAKLSDAGFRARAPAEKVAQHEERGRQLTADMETVRSQIALLREAV